MNYVTWELMRFDMSEHALASEMAEAMAMSHGIVRGDDDVVSVGGEVVEVAKDGDRILGILGSLAEIAPLFGRASMLVNAARTALSKGADVSEIASSLKDFAMSVERKSKPFTQDRIVAAFARLAAVDVEMRALELLKGDDAEAFAGMGIE
jgi:hypothetical protein